MEGMLPPAVLAAFKQHRAATVMLKVQRAEVQLLPRATTDFLPLTGLISVDGRNKNTDLD